MEDVLLGIVQVQASRIIAHTHTVRIDSVLCPLLINESSSEQIENFEATVPEPQSNEPERRMQAAPTSSILGPREDTAVRNNPFRRNQNSGSTEPAEEFRLPSPARPAYTPDAGGALAVIKETPWPEDLEPWVHKFPQEELAKFYGLTGVSHIAEHSITMRDDKPIKQRYFPKNPAFQRIIDEQIDDLLRNDCIEPSRSPHSATIVVVGKKSGEMR